MTTTASLTGAWDVTVRGDGPGLVLAHGAAGGIVPNFGLVLDDLAVDHRVVGPHYPGAGTTPARSRLELDELADGIVAAGRAAGLDDAVVIGESMGSAVAVRAATRHPEFVTGLILTVGFPVADPVIAQAADLVAALTEAGDARALRARARLLTMSCLTDSTLATIDSETLDAAVDLTERNAPAGTAAHFDLAARLDVRDDLARVDVPTLVVVATGDRLVLPAGQRRLAAGIPRAEVLELDEAAHILSPEDRATWLRRVRSFLGEHQ